MEKDKKKDLWKEDTIEIKGDFKLAIYANDYLDNPTEENLNIFKEEIEKSSSLSMAAVISFLKQISDKGEKIVECQNLLKLIGPKFEPQESKTGHYDPMLGEFVYDEEENKKINM